LRGVAVVCGKTTGRISVFLGRFSAIAARDTVKAGKAREKPPMRTVNTRYVPHLDGTASYRESEVKFRNFAEEATFLRKLVDRFSTDLALKELALRIVRDAGAEARDEFDQALAVGEWAQQNIYYVHEARETFQDPHITLKMMAGDCDKFAVLECALLGTLGIKNKLCILKINGRWAHIFAVALVVQDGQLHRLTLDGTLDKDRYPIANLVNPIALVRARGDRCEPLFV
jgi:Transglutaminase-like superfamily